MQGINLQREFNGQNIKTLLFFALENSQSQSFEQITAKKKLIEKLKKEGELSLTTEEIQIIKYSALQTLRDGATIAIIEEIAPNDLK